jgi:hypothetical protein
LLFSRQTCRAPCIKKDKRARVTQVIQAKDKAPYPNSTQLTTTDADCETIGVRF